jgi:hypothetical protein
VENEGQKNNREKMVMIINEWKVINGSSRGQPNPAGVLVVRVLLPLGGSDPARWNYPQGLAVVRVAASPIPEMAVGGGGLVPGQAVILTFCSLHFAFSK